MQQFTETFYRYTCVALAGNNHAGKSTFAASMNDRSHVSFAHELRNICSKILHCPAGALMHDHVKLSESPLFPGHTVRDVMITVATAIRSLNDTYFVDAALDDLDDSRIIIDDLRFMIEHDTIKKKYGDMSAIVLVLNGREEYTGDIDHSCFDYIVTRTLIDGTTNEYGYMIKRVSVD